MPLRQDKGAIFDCCPIGPKLVDAEGKDHTIVLPWNLQHERRRAERIRQLADLAFAQPLRADEVHDQYPAVIQSIAEPVMKSLGQ